MDTTSAVVSSSRPHADPTSAIHADPYERLTLEPASQAQILRTYQRDSSQIGRLIHLTSELLRSLAGTRWLAHRQTIVDVAVKAVYLLLTFGRGSQTLGEEYTDVLPHAQGRTLTLRRRLLTCLLLLIPSILTPTTISYLRQSSSSYSTSLPTTTFSRLKPRLLEILESPFFQSLPEIHLVLFMFGGRFYEFARRLTGIQYASSLPPKPPHHRMPSYEPLGLLMALPILYRLFPRNLVTPRPTQSDQHRPDLGSLSQLSPNAASPLTPPLTPLSDSDQSTNHRLAKKYDALYECNIIADSATYDTPNTYLTTEAQSLPERQCTLCLEPRGTGEGSGGTVAVTECGHVFCWGCLGGLEKPQCPLCRQSLRMERLVAAYNL